MKEKPGLKIRTAGVCLLLCLALFVVPPGVWAAPKPDGGVAVLVLHKVAQETRGSPFVLPPAEFARLLDELRLLGCTFIDLDTFHAYLAGKRSVPPRAVLLTFDDGYAGVYVHAHPVLAEHGAPARMFPVVKWFTVPPPEDTWPYLSTAQAREMLASGLWAFGSHTFDGHTRVAGTDGRMRAALVHPVRLADGSAETPGAYRLRVWRDIQQANTWFVRQLGFVPEDFAAPHGELSRELHALLRLAGYKYVYVQGKRLNYPGASLIYRLSVTDVDRALRDLADLFGLTVARPSTASR
ncbi:MAG: polysaccharide deacetylase family protein [Desulfotomaculales bacterium]